MYKGYKIIDMDTHVGPRADTLEKYIEPSFRARLPELEPYKRTRVAQRDGGKEERIMILTVAPLTFNRFPGTAPTPGDIRSEHGMRGTTQGRAIRLHRGPVQPGTDQENSQGRLKDMDLEGRDIDLMFPSDWAASITAIGLMPRLPRRSAMTPSESIPAMNAIAKTAFHFRALGAITASRISRTSGSFVGRTSVARPRPSPTAAKRRAVGRTAARTASSAKPAKAAAETESAPS